MSRDYFLNGETMVYVKGPSGSNIASLTQFGLAMDAVRIIPNFKHKDMVVDAWGQGTPETQFMLADMTVVMNLVHFDRTVLDTCMALSFGGNLPAGTFNRAGSRLGNNAARFAATNYYIGLNLASPVGNKPWRFFYSYLTQQPVDMPLGTEKSVVQLTWKVIPYTQDPWGGGTGAQGYQLFDYNLDS